MRCVIRVVTALRTFGSKAHRRKTRVISEAAQLRAYIEQHVDAYLEELAEFCAIPSIAADRPAIDQCVSFVCAMLARRGFAVDVLATKGNPAVFGVSGQGAATLLLYNHYDVQPADPVDAWTTPPFYADRRDGALYARGAIDDKGELIARIAAIDALRDKYGSLPLQIKFLIEGEEEAGSPNLEPLLQNERQRLRAGGCIWEAGSIDESGRPEIWLGVRGELYVELSVTTLAHDAHSGYAHLLPNAAWRLIRALVTLKDERERIQIPGFYDGVVGPSALQRKLLEELDTSGKAFKREFAIDKFVAGRSGMDVVSSVFEPTCNICGISSGYTGSSAKTVIPAEAIAYLDFRLVPNQDPDLLFESLKKHLRDSGFDDVIATKVSGQRAATSDPESPFVRLAIEAARKSYGQEPVVYPMVGGTGPAALFVQHLGIPFVSLGCSYPGSRKHASNEHIRIADFVSGAACIATLVERYAQAS